ncbi:hypothetical protein FGG08_005034 [Glutinoglossum americanum]|uniref:G2/M phase checkpoint control protein Sum2 n=1 Tax=Glutinoglossum americanum TaxID=1670608 RepID=A0A9P8I4G5_9PEZI|nr:hypothetical protein FGG08_005034 [Glutinoglossum americanum]
MTEFIGSVFHALLFIISEIDSDDDFPSRARISLVSRSDIRYVGTLHQISSEDSTVALEQVTSYGTEGRRQNPEDEIPASESVYEYIVFRGSDVKDLRIEEPAKPKENKPPQVPNDPAILGSGSRPPPAQTAQPPRQQPPYPPQFQQQPPYPYYYPPPGPRFPQGGPPQGPGFQGFQYGAPPWYPPPPQHGQSYPQPSGPFPAQQPTAVPPSQQQSGPKVPPPAPVGPAKSDQQQKPTSQQQPTEKQSSVKPANEAIAAAPVAPAQKVPTPPVEAKPDATTVVAPPAPVTAQAAAVSKSTPISAPTGPKSGRIMPAVPLPSPAPKPASAPALNGSAQPGSSSAPQQNASQPSQAAANAALQNATQAATAAVAAAMAKLPPAPGQKAQQGSDPVDNLTKKVNDMRTSDNARTSRQSGTSGHAGSHRGGRGAFRGGSHQQNRKVDVPTTDFDFESANAKFNKQDLVKEAIASGSPVNGSTDLPATNGSSSTSADGTSKDAEKVVIPAATYNKSTSFFDNISSDTKDRDDPNGKRPGGREWRGEEEKKNLETFGQGSVDNGYRGGFRRGRGRGWGGRGRGGYARGGRGSYRGGRNSQAEQNGTVGASV